MGPYFILKGVICISLCITCMLLDICWLQMHAVLVVILLMQIRSVDLFLDSS